MISTILALKRDRKSVPNNHSIIMNLVEKAAFVEGESGEDDTESEAVEEVEPMVKATPLVCISDSDP